MALSGLHYNVYSADMVLFCWHCTVQYHLGLHSTVPLTLHWAVLGLHFTVPLTLHCAVLGFHSTVYSTADMALCSIRLSFYCIFRWHGPVQYQAYILLNCSADIKLCSIKAYFRLCIPLTSHRAVSGLPTLQPVGWLTISMIMLRHNARTH